MGGNLDLMCLDGGVVLDWEGYQRLASWAALVFLWGLSVGEILTIRLYRQYS